MVQTNQLIGISFGNVNAVVAITNKDGKPEIIANADGERLTPSVVGFATGEEVAGTQAFAQAIRSPQTTVREFKALLGQSATSSTVKHHQNNFPVEIRDQNGRPEYFIPSSSMIPSDDPHAKALKDISITPQTVTAHLLAHLKETAEQYVGTKVDGCVISLPYAFTSEQRQDLLHAAKAASLRVDQLIHEPIAALLAVDVTSQSVAATSDKTCLIVDVGGYASTCTIVKVSNGIYDHVHHKTSFDIHSDRLTTLIRDHFAADYEKKNGVSLNKRALAKLHLAADVTKKTLSQSASGPCFVESLADGLDFQATLLRMKFEMLSRSAWAAWQTLVVATLDEAKISKDAIDEVLFVGGGSRTPKLISTIKDVFASDEDDEDEEEQNGDVNGTSKASRPRFVIAPEPETITALGAGYQACHLASLESDLRAEASNSHNVVTKASPRALTLHPGGNSKQAKLTLLSEGSPLPAHQRCVVPLVKGSGALLIIKEAEETIAEVVLTKEEVATAGEDVVDVFCSVYTSGDAEIAVSPRNSAWTKTVQIK